MQGLFRLQATAHVADKPQIVELESGRNVCNVNVVVNRKVYDKKTNDVIGTKQTWIACEFWGRRGKVAYSLIDVGDIVILEGLPGIYTFKSEDDPTMHKATITCNVSDFTVIKNRKRSRK